jgi:hypothetical protein
MLICHWKDVCESFWLSSQEAFMRGAENYAVETQLTRRVAEWTERMEPVLKQDVCDDKWTSLLVCPCKFTPSSPLLQEMRPEFNIYAYGNAIIHKLEEVAGTIAAFLDIAVVCNRKCFGNRRAPAP